MFVNGVSVVLIGDHKSIEGMSISWATQIEKSHVVLSLPIKSYITSRLVGEGIFSVNILGENQKEIAANFGGRECRESECSDTVETEYAEEGVPTLKDCCDSLICRLVKHEEIGDQVLCVCKVISRDTKNMVRPLIYEKSEYFK